MRKEEEVKGWEINGGREREGIEIGREKEGRGRKEVIGVVEGILIKCVWCKQQSVWKRGGGGKKRGKGRKKSE